MRQYILYTHLLSFKELLDNTRIVWNVPIIIFVNGLQLQEERVIRRIELTKTLE